MRELAAALAKKCKRTKPKTEKENKVSVADSQLAAISYPNRQSSGLGTGTGTEASQVSQEPEPLTDHATAASEVAAATRTTAKTVEIKQVECIIRYALLRNWISSTATPTSTAKFGFDFGLDHEIMAGMQLHLLRCCGSYSQMTYF